MAGDAAGELTTAFGLSASSTPDRAVMRLAGPVLRAAGGIGLGSDLDHVLERYQALRPWTARQAFLRTLRAGVEVRGQAITMLGRAVRELDPHLSSGA